ncbi:hypothetical protein RRF57_013203 [Xylaria bambusicola]|uniref:Uncharacterized protein n=1 Tax=Xylaria bambusicola TaxID=326684 RepID=A0AAN7V0I5_9PEZI
MNMVFCKVRDTIEHLRHEPSKSTISRNGNCKWWRGKEGANNVLNASNWKITAKDCRSKDDIIAISQNGQDHGPSRIKDRRRGDAAFPRDHLDKSTIRPQRDKILASAMGSLGAKGGRQLQVGHRFLVKFVLSIPKEFPFTSSVRVKILNDFSYFSIRWPRDDSLSRC